MLKCSASLSLESLAGCPVPPADQTHLRDDLLLLYRLGGRGGTARPRAEVESPARLNRRPARPRVAWGLRLRGDYQVRPRPTSSGWPTTTGGFRLHSDPTRAIVEPNTNDEVLVSFLLLTLRLRQFLFHARPIPRRFSHVRQPKVVDLLRPGFTVGKPFKKLYRPVVYE